MPKIIIIRGPAGVGKTEIAKKLSKQLKGKYISIDKIVEDYKLFKDKEKGMISQKSFLKANKILILKFNKEIIRGKILVIEGCFYWKSQINDLRDKFGKDLIVFTLKANLKACVERDRKRKKPIEKDAIGAVYNAVSKFDYGVLIEINNKNVDEVVEEVIRNLKT